MKRRRIMLLAAVAATGCASTPPPTERVSVAAAAVTHAEQNQADRYAPEQIERARRKLREARERIDRQQQDHYDEARRLAEQAEVDARYAEARSGAVRTTATQRELGTAVDALERGVGHAP